MSSCPNTVIPGHPEIYGLGIRLSFYILWFAIIAFNWLPPSLRGGFIALRIMHLVFSFAVFIGLAGAISSSSPSSLSSSFSPEPSTSELFHIDASEAYITLLLISSTIYLLVPLYLCRFLTCCLQCCGARCGDGWGTTTTTTTDYLLVRNNPNNRKQRQEDSESWNGNSGVGSAIVAVLEFIFLLLIVGFQCWFWWSGVDYPSLQGPKKNSPGCDETESYGFLFGKIELSDPRFKGFNSLVVLAVLAGAVFFSAVDAGICVGNNRQSNKRKRKRKRRKSHRHHISLVLLRGIQTVFNLGVIVTLLVAIELSIQWNHIPSDAVDQVTLPAQLMPLLITIALVVIVILHSLTADDEGSGYGDGGSSSGYGSSRSGRSGSGSGSGSSKGSSSSSSASSRGSGGRPVPGRDGEVVVDWSRGPNNAGGGQGFVPPGGGGFPVPPPPFPPPGVATASSGFPQQPIQPFPIFPRVNTVLVEPNEEGITTSTTDTTGSSPSSNNGNDHQEEGGSVSERISRDSGVDDEHEHDDEGRKSRRSSYRSSEKGDDYNEGEDNNSAHGTSRRVSGEGHNRNTDISGFGPPPVPFNMPFGRSPPTPQFNNAGGGGGVQRFPPPAWPPGWGHRETQTAAPSEPPPSMGFPPAPPMAFMPPGVVPPPPF